MKSLDLDPIVIDPETFLYSTRTLPALPKVLTQLQAAMQSEELTIKQVVGIVRTDAGLVAQILKVVNSAYYSLPRRVLRIDMAVGYLGIRQVHHIVLGVSLLNLFNAGDLSAFKRLWHHALYTALCARHLAVRFERHLDHGTLWVAALLHDIGKFVYFRIFPEHYKALRHYADEQGCLFRKAERDLGMPASSYLGTLLCDRWKLPGTVKETCARQGMEALSFLPDGNRQQPLHRMVILGDLIATLTTDPLRVEQRQEISEVIMKALSLSEPDFLVLMATATELKMEADHLASSD